MTVNNSANKVVAAGNGVQTVFGFSFIAVAASDLEVILTDSLGNETVLLPAQYSVALNPVPAGQIWAIGGTVTYPLVGSPIPIGSTLTIVRQLSLTQLVALGNQGNEFPSAVETALDLLEMQLQQVSELFQRAIVAPVVDAAAPLPLPPAAQRANLGMGFDGSGNPIAISTPASGAISSAMQPVVNAATLALGRSAFGLGSIATQNIGSGLQNDGAGNVRVNVPITQVATNQAVDATFDLQRYLATGPINFTLQRANTYFNGFGFWIYNNNAGAVTLVIDGNDAFVGYPSSQSMVMPPNTSAFISTDAANSGNWLVDWGLAPAPPMTQGGFVNLSIRNNAGTPNTQIDVAADEIVIPNTLAGAVKKTAVAFTINCATVGANGMDAGALPSQGWIYIFAISNGASVAGLASLSSSAPVMPAGFIYRKRIGAMRTDSSLHLLRTLQLGTKAVYTVVTGSNTTAPPVIFNGAQAFWTAAAALAYVPATASQIKLLLSGAMTQNSNTYAAAAPNNNYSTSANSPTVPLAIGGNANATTTAFCNQSAEMTLESANIYFGVVGVFGSIVLSCLGWTDNI